MRSVLLRSSLGWLVAAALIGCSSSPATNTGTLVPATVERDTNPTVASGDLNALVTGNTDFAFALYHGLSGSAPTGNLFYSPYSVSLALAMTYAGAGGSTATQMATALDFTLPAPRLNPAFDKLDLGIQAAPANAEGQDGQPFALAIADSLWGDQHVTFEQSFVNTLALDFGAGLRTVDFLDNPSAAETAINNWVASETNDKIDPLLGPGALTNDTAFVIVNAVYFNAGWATQFDKSLTKPGTFTRSDGTSVQTSLMASTATATAYAKGTGWVAAELPYSGGTTSMVVVLPDTGAYGAIESGLSASFFSRVTSALSGDYLINLTLPSFTIHGATVSLIPELQALGMTDAFSPGVANFSPMLKQPVYISKVLHQAFVDVDESGTEAAAATAVTGTKGAVATAPPPEVTVDVDRAFFFFIRNTATNTVLFVGREDDPTAE